MVFADPAEGTAGAAAAALARAVVPAAAVPAEAVVAGTGAVVDIDGLAPPLSLEIRLPAAVEPVWIVSVAPALLSALLFL